MVRRRDRRALGRKSLRAIFPPQPCRPCPLRSLHTTRSRYPTAPSESPSNSTIGISRRLALRQREMFYSNENLHTGKPRLLISSRSARGARGGFGSCATFVLGVDSTKYVVPRALQIGGPPECAGCSGGSLTALRRRIAYVDLTRHKFWKGVRVLRE